MSRNRSTEDSRSVAGGETVVARGRLYALGASLLLLAALLWAYWPTVYRMFSDWRGDPNYSVGQLVPLAALYLLWDKRDRLRDCPIKPCWSGLVLIAGGLAAWGFGLMFLYESAERYSLVLTLAGVVLLVGGRKLFMRAAWILAFLLLMIPLPGRVHNAVSGPLQQCATTSTVFVLEVVGVDVVREGNTLLFEGNATVGIAEACSGLRMLTAFIIVSAMFAMLLQRPRWQLIVLLLSSIPVAILCNVIRLIATAALYAVMDSSAAETFFHDFAGITMMPLAIAAMMGELWLFNKLIIPDTAPSKAPATQPSF